MKLKEIRIAKGISQRQAALAMNLSPTLYNRYENGTREPSNAMMLVIADYFGVTVDELLGREAPEEEKQHMPRTSEARLLAANIDKLPEADRKRAVEMFDLMFEINKDKFERNDDRDPEL